MISDGRAEVRGVLFHVRGGRLLLPNACISEVLPYQQPEPFAGSSDWLLGTLMWQGRRLPVVAFSQLAEMDRQYPGGDSKLVVVKSLQGDRRLSHFALLADGFPRLVTVSRDALLAQADEEALPEMVAARVLFNQEVVLIPDLDVLSSKVGEVFAAAA